MAVVVRWMERLPMGWKVATKIGAILAAGVGVGRASTTMLADARSLPDRVGRLEVRADIHEREIDELRGADQALGKRVDRILCLVEAQAGIRPFSECVR